MMVGKRILSFLLVLVFLISFKNMNFTKSFANEKELTSYEFFNKLQQLIDNNSSDILDSMLPPTVDRLIVKTTSNQSLNNDYGAVASLEGYNGLHILQYETEEEAEYAFNAFQNEEIEYVEYDYWLMSDTETPEICNCPENTDNYGLCRCKEGFGMCDCEDDTSPNHFSWNSSAVMVDDAFNLLNEFGIECEPVNVAVIDSGLYVEHFDTNRIDVNTNYKLTIDDVEYPSTTDMLYHGTHVTGIIYDNTMSNVTITPYRIFGKKQNYLPYSILCGALDTAIERKDDNGNKVTDIINMSISHVPYLIESQNITLYETLQKAIDNNIVVVVCAGNDSNDAQIIYPQISKKP